MNEYERIRRDKRRRDSENMGIEGSQSGSTMVSGQFMFSGVGEALVAVTFPITFREKPFFSFGGELDSYSDIVLDRPNLKDGKYPKVSVVVSTWTVEEVPPYKRLYKGANLAVVVAGVPDQLMIVEWHAMGVAYQNPLPLS